MKIDTRKILIKNTPSSGNRQHIPGFLQRKVTFRGLKLFGEMNTRNRFFNELSILLSSGMDLRFAFEVLIEDVGREADKKIYRVVYEAIKGGKSLHEALAQAGMFSVYDVQSVKIGEESGTLTKVVGELAGYYCRVVVQRKQIISALTYPTLVVATTFLSMLFMMRFVVPMFRDIFTRFQGELPSVTRFIVSISESFGLYTLIFIGILITLIGGCWLIRKEAAFRRIASGFIMRVPLAGRITGLIFRIRFCQTMNLLQSSDIKLLDSVVMIRNMIGFYPYEQALDKIKDDIIAGKSLADSMQQFSIFDRRLVSLTRVGEEVNKIGEVYEKLTAQYTQELETGIKSLNSILEPVLIIFVGGLVAFILVSMYLPIFQTGSMMM
ncbi:MAG: type II secretion system F family protein [Bacteroidales bacterium]|jgi:type IV pilus assembly protein PilC|nr:type II secretion system F family protein [Bacteroidales bacterium]